MLVQDHPALAKFTRTLPAKTQHGAVIVETRPYYKIINVIKNHLYFLPKHFGLTVVHASCNSVYIKGMVNAYFKNAHFILLDGVDTMNSAQYNSLLASSAFWGELPYKKALIFQHDSFLRRQGIEAFEQYDYVGAPWKFQQHGGNGGLSYRTIAVMKDICERHRYITGLGNEDVYFSNYMHNNRYGKLAPRDISYTFAVETIFNPNPFGCHAINNYLSTEECNQLQNVKYDGKTPCSQI